MSAPPPLGDSAHLQVLPFDALERGDNLAEKIALAFGEDGLGLLSVSGVPGLAAARARLLPLASAFASLPEEAKAKYERPDTYFNVGWSHGREKLQGRPDHAKASYYANPLHDDAFAADAEAVAQFPAFAAPNVWPAAELPELEAAFRDAGQLAHRVGCLVAAQCDAFVRARCESYPAHLLEEVIRTSRCCKGRLLHYYPREAEAEEEDALTHRSQDLTHRAGAEADGGGEGGGEGGGGGGGGKGGEGEGGGSADDDFSSWCGWHNDHGSLTALLPAMYLRERPAAEGGGHVEVPSPDPSAGLYIRSRRGQLVKAKLPSGHLGFQIGETAQVHSGGLLQATPHAVRGCSAPGVSRAAFAVFMEPEWGFHMRAPEGRGPADTQSSAAEGVLPKGVPPLRTRWGGERPEMDFGEFTEATLAAYH